MCVCDILHEKYISYSSHIFLYDTCVSLYKYTKNACCDMRVYFAEVGHLCILFYGLIYFCVSVFFKF